MSILFKIVRATHANGTHHKLALDALKSLNTETPEKWVKLFLKHGDIYLEGSKEPDKVFKDFKNHVLHVNDNYWGGAEAKCQEWYDEVVRRLNEGLWEDAVYAAGVLSHYYTDPIMPFHTAQSEAESAIHRAVEWTVNKSYEPLKKQGEANFPLLEVVAPERGGDFAAKMVREGAEASNKYYSHLIAHYDFDRGVVTPTEGYNELGRQILSELLIYASRGFGVLLSSAIQESGAAAPNVNLTPQILMAGLKIPVKWVLRKIDNAEDRRAVEAMYDEMQSSGRVDKTLREDDRMIRELHRTEVLGAVVEDEEEPTDAAIGEEMGVDEGELEDLVEASDVPDPEVDQELRSGEPNLREKRPDQGNSYFLDSSDAVEDAPSIGVKTSKRLAGVNIKTVSDLLEAQPETLSADLEVSYITPQVVREWQDQARLQCEIPRLRGNDAQFLVGCGYRDKRSVSEADPETMLVDLQAFILTSAGERLLRVGNEPDLELIKGWIEKARLSVDDAAA